MRNFAHWSLLLNVAGAAKVASEAGGGREALGAMATAESKTGGGAVDSKNSHVAISNSLSGLQNRSTYI